jgi:hypothetical protein
MSRVLTRPTILLLVPMLLPTAAHALRQRADPATTPQTESARITEIEFREIEAVEGTRVVPGGEVVTGQGRASRPSLIVVRPSFRPELLRSADDL